MPAKINKKKAVILVIMALLVCFLLLPVFFGRRKAAGPAVKAVPQAASSNPLTKAVNFLASLIGLNKEAGGLTPSERYAGAGAAALTPAQRDALGLYAAKGSAASSPRFNYSDDNVRLPEDLARNYGMAEVRDKEGNWVLVRQEMPAVSSRGMYDSNIKEDPSSVLESRRISDSISLDNREKYAYSGFMPLGKMFDAGAQAGMNLFSNSFRAPGRGEVTERGEYYARAFSASSSGGGAGGGANADGGDGSSRGNAGGHSNIGSYERNNLEEIFAAAARKAEDMKAAQQPLGPDGKPLTEKQKEEARREEEKQNTRESFYNGLMAATEKSLSKLEAAAKEEMAANEGKIITFDKLQEYDIVCAQDMCEEKEYSPVPSEVIKEKSIASAKEILSKWIKGFNDDSKIPPDVREKFIQSYLSGIKDDKLPPLPDYIKPKYIFALVAGEKPHEAEGEESNDGNTPQCTSANGCYWVSTPSEMNPNRHMAIMAGGDMYYGVKNLKGQNLTGNDSDAANWRLVSSEELAGLAKSTEVKKGAPDFEENLSVFYVTTPSNGLKIHNEMGVHPSKIVYTDKKAIITKNTEREEESSAVTVEKASGDIEAMYVENVTPFLELAAKEKERAMTENVAKKGAANKKQPASGGGKKLL